MAKKKKGSQSLAIVPYQGQGQTAANQPQKQKKKKKNKTAVGMVRDQPVSSRAILSQFQMAWAKPFDVSGARVPDGDVRPTAIGSVRVYHNNNRPVFNFTNTAHYVNFVHGPFANVSAANTTFLQGTTGPSNSFSDYTGNPLSTMVVDLTKTWGVSIGSGGLSYISDRDLVSAAIGSHRVSGGGVRIRITGATDSNPCEVLATSVFNGGQIQQYYDRMQSICQHKFIVNGDATITIPFGLRHSGTAYTWISANGYGNAATDYPVTANKGLGTNELLKSYSVTGNSQNTVWNEAVRLISMQDGMGAVQLMAKIAPNCSFSAEAITHFEADPVGRNVVGYSSNDLNKVALPNEPQLDDVERITSMYASGTSGKPTVSGEVDPLSWPDKIKGGLGLVRELAMDAFDTARHVVPLARAGMQMYNYLRPAGLLLGAPM